MFGKNKNSELSQDIMTFKNALEEVRFTPEVEHDTELIEMFDEAIDKAENGEAVQTIYARLYYQIIQYIQTHHFKAPKPVSDFIHGTTASVTSGLTSVPVSWNTVH